MITVSYRVTCLASLTQEEGGSGGAGGGSGRCARVGYDYTCSNGTTTSSSASFCWTHSIAALPGGQPPDPSNVTDIQVSSPTGEGPSPAPAPGQIDGVKCFPPPPPGRGGCGGGGGGDDPCKDTNRDQCQEVGSSVNLTSRKYFRDEQDLSVKVPGGAISVERIYYGGRWKWWHTRNLGFEIGGYWSTPYGGGATCLSIGRDHVDYKAVSSTWGQHWGTIQYAKLYTYGSSRITKLDYDYGGFTGPAFKWEDKQGNWELYHYNGKMLSYGSPNGVTGKLLYEDQRLVGIADRNDRQVVWFEYNEDGWISAAYDITNRHVEYFYAYKYWQELIKVIDVLGNETFYEYDAGSSKISKVIDAAGRESTISYDQWDGVSLVSDSRGEGCTFDYDYDGSKKEYYTQIKTPSGMVKEIWYNGDGETKRIDINGRTIKKIEQDGRNLIITDERGNVTRKDYDEWDNLTRVVYPDGATITYEYEHTFNKRVRKTDERGMVTEYEYDDQGNLTRMTEAAGTPHERITEYTYDTDGNQLTIRVLGDTDTPEALTTMEYDENGTMASITDPEGNTTYFTYDIMGNLLTKTDARDKVWTYQYDALGRLTSTTDPINNTTQLFYDEVGNQIREVDPEGGETLFAYDIHDNLIKTTDPAGNETFFVYNTDNKLIQQTDPEGKVIYYEYDNEGRLTTTIDGNGNEITMEYESPESGCPTCSRDSDQPTSITYPTFSRQYLYDTRGRKTEEKDILSDTEEYETLFEYDSSGNLITKTDKEGKSSTYEYDELNRLIEVIDPLANETHYTYDNRDNLISLTDANGNTTIFEYDENNRLTKETRPMGEETTYQYDGVGNLVQKIDAKNQKTEYTYDDAGRMTEIRYFSTDDHTTPVKTVAFTYDKVGNLMGYDDGTTSATYSYDDVYRKTSETINYGPFQKTYSYTYYNNGLKKTFTDPNGTIYTYTYDNNNQLTGIQIPGTGSITYPSYTWNRPASMTLPGGSTKEFAYDPLMRINSITTKDPGQNPLMNYAYAYDRMDNIVSKVTEHGEYAYEYDDLYRLMSSDPATGGNEAFTYDPVGNRLTSADTTGLWSYNDNNELNAHNDTSYEYDDNGNMVRKTAAGIVTNYIYNIEDRLVEVQTQDPELGTQNYFYYYDPFGRRLWKEVGGTKTYFLYADEGLIGEYDSTGTEIKTYGYKPGSTWTTDPLFMKEGGNYYFYQNDHLGTPQKMTGVNGAVVWSATYSSFGEATVDGSFVITNNLRFPGQYYDEETGLHYNYHRYYDPRTGRYLKSDPIKFHGDYNLYRYSFNNPIVLTDPVGLLCVSCCKNCEQKLVIRNRLTSEVRDYEDLDWDIIIQSNIREQSAALLILLQTLEMIPPLPSPPPDVHKVTVGKHRYEEEWVKEQCIEEICLDFLMQPLYFDCKEIEKYWVQYKEEDIYRFYIW